MSTRDHYGLQPAQLPYVRDTAPELPSEHPFTPLLEAGFKWLDALRTRYEQRWGLKNPCSGLKVKGTTAIAHDRYGRTVHLEFPEPLLPVFKAIEHMTAQGADLSSIYLNGAVAIGVYPKQHVVRVKPQLINYINESTKD